AACAARCVETKRLLASAPPESVPVSAPSCSGPSIVRGRCFSPGLAKPPPSAWKTASGSPSLSPGGRPCGTRCRSLLPGELRFALPAHRDAPGSSCPAATQLQTASSGGAACPPDTAHPVCESPPDSPRSRSLDPSPRCAAPCRTYVPPCAEWFPCSTHPPGCHRTSHS